MTNDPADTTRNLWRPSATLQALRKRAELLKLARAFFEARQVLEVETPLLVNHGVTDLHLRSLQLEHPSKRYLHTSPELAMKRLLAAGSGDIFQICRVFRAEEAGPLHNPEFTMIEWYRQSFSLQQMETEACELLAALLNLPKSADVERKSYSQIFQEQLQLEPLTAPTSLLAEIAQAHGLVVDQSLPRDDLLDFLMGAVIGPQIGARRLTVIDHYPASQAALAQYDQADPRTALRFEVYFKGIELANGYVELTNPVEQRRRFELDIHERSRRGLASLEWDPHFLSALEAGLPACAGVALGFDRAVMLAVGARTLAEVLAFDWARA